MKNKTQMKFHNRKILLLNNDFPINTSSPPPPPPQSSQSSMFLNPTSMQLPPRPIFTSNLAYAFLFLFTAVFFLGFILLYIRHFSSNFDSDSIRRRLRRCNSYNGGGSSVEPLPELPYCRDTKPQQAECAICLDEFREGITVKMIPYCKHVFHPECIDTWLVEHVTCPVCRCEKICCEGDEKVESGRVDAREEEEEEERRRVIRDSSNNGSRFALRRSLSF